MEKVDLMKLLTGWFKNALILGGLAWLLSAAYQEIYMIAWGTGLWMGELSFTWAMLCLLFVISSISLFVLMTIFLWKPASLSGLADSLAFFRERMLSLRWALAFFILLVPVWFFQYTAWGFVFHKIHLRLLAWLILVFILSFLFSRGNSFIAWKPFLASLVLTIGIFSIASNFRLVTDYPFSLGWSEGNRLWDYSILFGRDRYDYPPDRQIPVLLEFGRQLVGAIPFLFSDLSIRMERMWVSFTLVAPYILLGIVSFRFMTASKGTWLIAALWTFLFLNQGPINPSLLLVASLAALAWRTQLRYAVFLILLATFYAALSRFTWVFAPGIWIVMLEFASASFVDRTAALRAWRRSLTLGISGVLAGLIFPVLIPIVFPQLVTVIPAAASSTGLGVQPSSNVPLIDLIRQQIADQPLLWYRLLPNSTYGNGILLAIFLAVVPALAILSYLVVAAKWELDRLQKLSLILPLVAFFIAGLIISTKIGGGGDLHNMDMFLIGMFFCVVIAWKNGGAAWLQGMVDKPSILMGVIIVLLAISPLDSLMAMRPYEFGDDAPRLMMLTDAVDRASLEMLPTSDTIDLVLELIQSQVDESRLRGEILFMDQRQLLTFGYIRDVELVPEYEKKVLMNNALSADEAYFEIFYKDLAAHRFSLIITQPLSTPIQDSSFQFGEENNAWVQWVSTPVLCYYEPLRLPWRLRERLRETGIQLLVPRVDAVNCAAALP